jgi:urease subunit alpha
MARLSRQAYADLYGPTKGDLIRLGDTELFAEIEHDYTVYGHELLIGAGKNLRDGEGINGYLKSSDGILDIVIKNATIVDAVTGVVKADIGICEAGSSGSARQAILTSCPESNRTWWSARRPRRCRAPPSS